MRQSKYTAISKRLGFRLQHVSLPTKERAGELERKVKAGDETAFAEVFKIHRFACSAETEDETVVQRIIFDAFQAGSRIFRELEA